MSLAVRGSAAASACAWILGTHPTVGSPVMIVVGALWWRRAAPARSRRMRRATFARVGRGKCLRRSTSMMAER